MRVSRFVVLILVVLLLGGVLGFGLASWVRSGQAASEKLPMYVSRKDAAASPGDSSMGFAPVFKPVLPAVVSITSSRIVKMPQAPFFNDPFFQQFFGRFPHGSQPQREKGLGSGVIVSPNGYILTNNHVVDKGTDIKVELADKREFGGKVIGTDPKTDIAVLKIDASGLPAVTLGDSASLRVGDYAFAVGNPFGVGETATMGIISATGRNGLSIEDYEDFIQTDAAINPGNSGGALLNAHGELIGINTAILSGGSGGNQGVGFAVPINMAKYVMEQIMQHGKVVRGYIGVGIQEVTPELAKAFSVPAEKGALVGNVEAGSPGAKAGLERGDVIEQVNGQPVKGPNELRLQVGAMAPGTTLHLQVNRAGQTRNMDLVLGEAPAGKTGDNAGRNNSENGPMQGVQVEELTGSIRQQLNLPPDASGVVVDDVAGDSSAADAGLQRGDVIEQVNRRPVKSVPDYQRFVREAGNQAVVLLVNRRGDTTFIVVQPQ